MKTKIIILERNSPTILNQYLREIRDKTIQKDPLRFRINLARISQILAYEVSKEFSYQAMAVQTPLGTWPTNVVADKLVIASILRAGLPMHYSLLEMLDHSENAFISAYRKYSKSGKFEILLEYISTPSLDEKTILLADPMIATGASIAITIEQLERFGKPRKIIVLGIIASQEGLEAVAASGKVDSILVASTDDELTAKGYIVPGLGDAGDLAFGPKV